MPKIKWYLLPNPFLITLKIPFSATPLKAAMLLMTHNFTINPSLAKPCACSHHSAITWQTCETSNYWLPANNYSHYSPNHHRRPAINLGSSQPWNRHDGHIRRAVQGGDVVKEEDVWACCQQAWDVDDKWPVLVSHQTDVCVIRGSVFD